ncbi:response regulator transcription factor [Acetonema longum]|uniref:Two component transcriptional regulator, winged helix family protein n=1 Tax=Acetonema longum DSM 6540 TaxID=1009370 RepID=F7NFG6_9FIRM|nr:response regulator transcription factor [Acetonema longum]EGO65221.1 two component transcriptional regulator, winged helix family protein [Acetonema longum DSM 6540]
MGKQIKILIVDDNADIRDIVSILLSDMNYTVLKAEDSAAAMKLLLLNPNIDLIILDIMLPDQSGFDVCREMRQKTMAPILFLTAKAHIADKKYGFDCGGDDYLLKPFSSIELSARVQALLRRYAVYQGKSANQANEYIKIRELLVHPTAGEVSVAGIDILLRHIEYQLLVLLAKNRDQVFSVQTIYETIWQEPFMPASSNTVMVHIKNLRQKIEKDPQNPKYIVTVWGKGYKLI